MKTAHIVLALLTLGLLPSCCTKKYCYERHEIPVTFMNFTAADLDTIYVTGYATDGTFSTITSAEQLCVAEKMGTDSTFEIIHSQHSWLGDDQHWQIRIPATNATYRISGYLYTRYRCNNCPLDKEYKIESLASCKLNGAEKGIDPLVIEK